MKNTFLFFPERLEGAKISIVGAPYDLNSSRRYGSRYAPEQIREESLYLEDNFRGVPLDLPVEDTGDVPADSWNIFRRELGKRIGEITERKSIPLVLGGDHSITPVIIEALDRKDISVVAIDAHLDFDEKLNGNRFSHGTPRRREAEILGGERIHILGVRSWQKASRDRAEEIGVHIYDAFEIRRNGMDSVSLPEGPVYLTIDIDGLDPVHAPGTGTPEPFGLSTWDILSVIDRLSSNIVGMDIVEVCPPADINEITSTVASRLAASFIASFFSAERQH